VLEATIPYELSRRCAGESSRDKESGPAAVALRDNNIAALRDLNSRVIPRRRTVLRAHLPGLYRVHRINEHQDLKQQTVVDP
jgi:hypothetical protein